MLWSYSGKEARMLAKFCRLFSRMEEGDVGMVLFMAQKDDMTEDRLKCKRPSNRGASLPG
jgi:hypothetical protein